MCGLVCETVHVYNLVISARSGNIILISLLTVTQSAEDKKTTRDICIQWWEESGGVTYVLLPHILSHNVNRWLINTFSVSSLGAVVLVKLKWDEAVTPPSRSLVQPSTCKHSRRTGKLVCMEEEGCCGRCIMLCAGSKKNWKPISWIIERTDLERGKFSLAFVGKLYLRVRKHLVLQPGTDRRLFITFTGINTTAVMSFVSCSVSPEQKCSAAVVLYQVHLVSQCSHAKTLMFFCVREKASNLHNSLRNMYVAPAPWFPLHTGGDKGAEPGRHGLWAAGFECFIYMQVQPSLWRMICRVRSLEEKIFEVILGSSHTSAVACLIKSFLLPVFWPYFLS